MNQVFAVLAALGSALCFSVASVLQQRSARVAPKADALRPRLLLDLARRPVWVAGSVASGVAFALQGLALHFGDLAFVQPLLLAELVFALPLAVRLRGQSMGRREWTATVAIAGGLALLLQFASPGGGRPDPAITTWIGIGGGAGLVVSVLVLAARGPARPLRATLLGACAGVAFGVLAALLDSVTFVLAGQGLVHALATWQPYALAVIAFGGEVLAQSAYQAGPLPASLPVMDALEPAVAIAIGVAAFGDQVTVTATTVGPELVGLAMIIVGIVALDRSPLILELQADPGNDGEPFS